ncbi:MAG: DUF3734 domain-containing protein [Actinomycetota bacterium]|nr:DUF3734 domain-containing protein [Actinomycetota bacterium]
MRIDGDYWWDLGIYSNTPLNAVLDDEPPVDTLCFLVQLFTPEGPLPRRIDEVMTRHKDITYASRADRSISNEKEKHDLRRAVDALCRRLPPEQRNDPQVQALWRMGRTTTMHIVRLRHRARAYELESKDYEFSRLTIEEHLREGYEKTWRQCRWLQQITLHRDGDLPVGVLVHDPELEDLEATIDAAAQDEQPGDRPTAASAG